MDLIEKFKKYVGFDTTSSENVKNDKASTDSQYALSEELAKELTALGGQNVHVNRFGTVYGFFPGQLKRDPIALIAHIDTSPSASGKDIKPRLIKGYDGKDIELSKGITMKVADFPTLKDQKGDDLIVTDGTTLLGADDKAGIAIIMDLIDGFVSSETPHGPLEAVFSTDEEVGVGADHIDVKELKSKFGYTIDGGDIHYINVENFNAASMEVTINGRSIHPGSAKDKMINAINVGMEFHESLPRYMRPEDTENREGFYHILAFNGNEEKVHMEYIIRDHDLNRLHDKMEYAKLAGRRINDSFGQEVVEVKIVETYKNMKAEIDKHPEVIEKIEKIYKELGIAYHFEPIRGGTDGAVLTFRGFPCPNLPTGGFNCHGRFEYADVTQMKQIEKILAKLFIA
ncbi:MAG: peptidase T [Bacilli bacterium]|jgi:tripeptide aminopeptidase|nr:peptidase T [Bacilli bacterium]